jgi:predicted acylesterase/phospholipase RssA
MPVNLVFQGGGVRGIAYAGALETMPPDLSIRGVAGTSAGAIIAALIGIGKSPQQIKAVLQDDELNELIHADDVERLERIRSAGADLKPLVTRVMESGDVSLWQIWTARNKIKSLAREIGFAWQSRGFHRSDKVGLWLAKILEGKTFDDAKAVEDVQIVAADISKQEYKVYSKKTHPGMPLAQAVHASASIPIFFLPFTAGTDILVDGGILSNYPAFLFAGSRYATIGFRLKDLMPPGSIAGTLQYLHAVFQTMAEAHDKERPLPRHVFTYSIITPPHIPFDKFKLTETDKAELVYAGEQVGRTVKWLELERKEREVSFFDPKADETLEFSVGQARSLYDRSVDQSQWVETLHHDAELTVRVEQNWTTVYNRVSTLRVEGNGSVFLSRFRAVGLPQSGGGTSSSLLDIRVSAEEVTGGNVQELIRIPAYNSQTHKGFVLFYTPPVSKATGARTFRSRFDIDREFHLVPQGEPGYVSYGVQRVAQNHIFGLKLRILTDTALPALLFSSDFGVQPQVSNTASKLGNRYYTEHVWEVGAEPIHGEALYNVTVRLDRNIY